MMIKEVIKNNFILIIQYAMGALVPLLLVPHIVRSIGLNNYGSIAIGLSLTGYGSIVVQYAFQLTGPKHIAQLHKDETSNKIFANIITAKLLLLALVLPLLVFVSWYAIPPIASSRFWFIWLILPMAAALNSVWFLQAENRFLWICLLSIIGSICTLLIGFWGVKGDDLASIWAALLATFIGQIFTGVTTFFAAWYLVKPVRQDFTLTGAIEMLREGWPLFLSQFVSSLYGISGPVIISYLIGVNEAGAYSAVERFTNGIIGATLLIHTAAYPTLARLYLNDRLAYFRLLRFVLFSYLSIIFCVIMLVASQLGLVVKFVLGDIDNNYNALIASGFMWMQIAIFGTALTGYLTVSGQSDRIFSLTSKILVISLSLAIPGVLILGASAWMASICIAQILVLVVGWRAWRHELYVIKQNDKSIYAS